MLKAFTTTSLAALVAATFSAGALAQTQNQQQQTQNYQQEREYDSERKSYEKGGDYSDKKIVEVLGEKDRFSMFHEALEHADMKDKLNGDDSYTVFAPTDEAFERLPEGTWDEWMEDGNRDQLREVLSYHIVEERISTDDIGESRESKDTMNDGELRISQSFGSIMVNTASVSYADIEAENGYIHGIDTVLLDSQQGAGYSATE
ncbi:MAG: fasciclin domain-containing protein [Idiomarina sp.]|nr:fasciclin domain-containing protein [Idiomarina sp.]